MRSLHLLLTGSVLAVAGCGGQGASTDPLDRVADEYVRLVLAVGRHDVNYVDAYYGPKAWKDEAAKGDPRPVAELRDAARALLARVESSPPSARREFLSKELIAVEGFTRKLSGETLGLAEEARVLFDIEVQRRSVEELEAVRSRLEAVLPGQGDLATRAEAFRKRFEVPADRLPAVVRASLEEARRRTALRIALPPGEAFRVSFVTGKPWGAYNWYQGGFTSLIEVNTDLPAGLGQVFDTVVHEGYPGHHTYNVLLERDLVRGRGWREYTVAPLYSPMSVLAEGTADLGAEIIATDGERLAFLRDVLAPLAGLSGLDLETLARFRRESRSLAKARCEGVVMLLEDGKGEPEVVEFLRRYALLDEARARKAIDFARAYRAYEFTYSVGEDLVRSYVGDGPDRERRFFDLLGRPETPSGLRRAVEDRRP